MFGGTFRQRVAVPSKGALQLLALVLGMASSRSDSDSVPQCSAQLRRVCAVCFGTGPKQHCDPVTGRFRKDHEECAGNAR